MRPPAREGKERRGSVLSGRCRAGVASTTGFGGDRRGLCWLRADNTLLVGRVPPHVLLWVPALSYGCECIPNYGDMPS